MRPDTLAQFSQRMVTITMLLMIAVVLLSMMVLFIPLWSFSDDVLGINLILTDRVFAILDVNLTELPWWQAAGAVTITLLVLFPLCFCLYQLRELFLTYARREYFSLRAAQHMRKVGGALGIWIVMTLINDPLLSYWLTMLKPTEQLKVLFSFELHYVVWLFVSACIMAVARILEKASLINEENKLFL